MPLHAGVTGTEVTTAILERHLEGPEVEPIDCRRGPNLDGDAGLYDPAIGWHPPPEVEGGCAVWRGRQAAETDPP